MAEGVMLLAWKNHHASFYNTLAKHKEKGSLTDATLICEGKSYQVHKLVLSACSDHLEKIFESTPCRHPVIVLHGIGSIELECLLNYMYVGEVNVPQKYLTQLIKAAELMEIKGLAVSDVPQPTEKLKENKASQPKSTKQQELQAPLEIEPPMDMQAPRELKPPRAMQSPMEMQLPRERQVSSSSLPDLMATETVTGAVNRSAIDDRTTVRYSEIQEVNQSGSTQKQSLVNFSHQPTNAKIEQDVFPAKETLVSDDNFEYFEPFFKRENYEDSNRMDDTELSADISQDSHAITTQIHQQLPGTDVPSTSSAVDPSVTQKELKIKSSLRQCRQEKLTARKNEKSQCNYKIYKCSICLYKSKRLSHLKRHMKNHENNFPHQCHQCNYSSGNKGNVTFHAMNYH